MKLTVAILALLLAGCAAAKIHPGSPNLFDSTTYDSLIVTHSVIESTKTDLANSAFPASTVPNIKKALNDLVTAYNAADTTYQAYHTSALAGTATAAQQSAVQNALNNVNTATSALTAAKAAK